jgi:Flp pilus assembly protein TadG
MKSSYRSNIRQSIGKKATSSRDGAATLETAIVLPTLLLIMLGAADFGRFATVAMAVNAAARAGAYYGAINPYNSTSQSAFSTGLNQAVTNEMQSMYNSTYGASSLSVAYLKTNDSGTSWRIQVTVSFPFQTIVTWPGIPHTMTITDSVQMRGIR